MNTIELDEIDFSVQLHSYILKSEESQVEFTTDDILIRLKSNGEKGVAKIELMVSERFPVSEYPDRLEPIDEALREFDERFESFTRKRGFYELVVEE